MSKKPILFQEITKGARTEINRTTLTPKEKKLREDIENLTKVVDQMTKELDDLAEAIERLKESCTCRVLFDTGTTGYVFDLRRCYICGDSKGIV